MTESLNSTIEEKMSLATQVQDPRDEFADNLWKKMITQPVHHLSITQQVQLLLSKPVWAVSMALMVVIIGVAIAGPQRVLATVQGLLGYIPGVGFVNMDNVNAMKAPVEMSQNGETIRVEQLLSSDEETVLVLRVQNYLDTQDIGLDNDELTLVLSDGDILKAGSYGIERDWTTGDYIGVFKFTPLPSGTRQVSVLWNQSAEGLKWQIPLTLVSGSDTEVSKTFPPSYEPANASATQHGITLTVDEVSQNPSNTGVRLQITFPQGFVFGSPESATLADDLGNVYQQNMGQVAFEDQGQPYQVFTTPGPSPQIFKSLHETLEFSAIDPPARQFTLQINQLNFRATSDAVFSVDMGKNPKIGESSPINQTVTVGDLMLHVKDATLVSLKTYSIQSRWGIPGGTCPGY